MAHRVAVSNPDKVVFPRDGITKGELVDYYRQVADAMLPHLQDRPLSLQRFPDGIEHQGFFQQQASEHFPHWLQRVPVPRRGGGSVEHPVCDDADTLAYPANLGVVTFHVWTSRVSHLERPDRVVFDLDPPDDRSVERVRDAARRVRDVLAELGLVPFVRTSGSRGFHVVHTGQHPQATGSQAGSLAGDGPAGTPLRASARATGSAPGTTTIHRLTIWSFRGRAGARFPTAAST